MQTVKMQLVIPVHNAKEAVLSHNTRMVELLSFIELQYQTGYAKPVQYLHPCR